MKLSEYVRLYRKEHRISLRDMAKKCNCSFQYLSKLEKGEISSPSMPKVINLAHGMGMSVNELLEIADDFEIDCSYQAVMSDTLFDAYENAPENIQKAVCALLGVESQ